MINLSELKFSREFNLDDFDEFCLMMSSKILYTSNSTFSWWAARLGNIKDVTVPKNFLGPRLDLPQYKFPQHWKQG